MILCMSMDPAAAGGDLYGVREIWPAGTIIKGDYVIERKLGGGGFGSVYLAKHRYLNSLHVIKRMHQNLQEEPEFVRKFFKEGQLMTRLKDCPYIVQVQHMTHTDDKHLILVMEHIDGGDLSKLMTARTLSVDEVLEFGRQIARGLAAAHAVGVIHRDVKPENALLTKDASGRPLVKLIDFGIAADHAGSQHTSVAKMGSIGFAAPEQWMKSGKDIDGRADIYALAATMYRLLCGRMPYEGATEPWPWLMRVQQGPPDAPGSIRGDCPGWLSDALMKALAALPENRPANAMEFHDLLIPAPVITVVEPRAEEPVVEVAPAQPEVRTVVERPDSAVDYAFAAIVAPPEAKVTANRRSRTWAVAFGSAAMVCFGLVATWVYLTQKKHVPEPQAGEIKVNPKDGLRYAYIPPGTFRMGCASSGDEPCSKDEKPAHDVRITKGFWMGQTEVTVEAYKRFAGNTGKTMPRLTFSENAQPMTEVSWHDAVEYCSWAGLRLPTEAEWEYAARAGTSGARYASLDSIAWSDSNSGGQARGVARKQANAFKLYDMLGNVWEWTADWFKDKYESSAQETDPQGPPGGEFRVLRGGSWGSNASGVRASFRYGDQPSYRLDYVGFRCVGETLIP